MASTYTDNLRLELMAKDEKAETWGSVANTAVFQLIEDALTAETSINTTGGTTTLTTSNGATDTSRSMFIDVTGALVSSATIIAPAKQKLYIIRNGTSGSFTVTLEPSGGTGLTITQGETIAVYIDGSVAIQIGQGSFTVTSFAKTLLDDSDASTMLATLGLSTYADKNLSNEFIDPQTIFSTSGGSGEGPGLDLDRRSASPAGGDRGGVTRYKGRNDAAETITYAKTGMEIDDVSDGNEDGHLYIASTVAGVLARLWFFREGIWTPSATGGNQGAGTLNIEGGYYINGSRVPVLRDLVNLDLTSDTETTSIPSGTVGIDIILNGVSSDTANNTLRVELADSATYPSSASSVSIALAQSQDVQVDSLASGPLLLVGDANGNDNADWDAGNAVSGTVYLRKDDEDRWSMTASLHDTTAAIIHTSSGFVDVSGTVDRLKLTVGSGSIDAGEATIKVYQ